MSHFHSTNKRAEKSNLSEEETKKERNNEKKKERKKEKQAHTNKQTIKINYQRIPSKIKSNRLSSTFTKRLTIKLLFPIKYVFCLSKNYITSNGTSTKSIKKSQLSIIFHFTSQNFQIQ